MTLLLICFMYYLEADNEKFQDLVVTKTFSTFLLMINIKEIDPRFISFLHCFNSFHFCFHYDVDKVTFLRAAIIAKFTFESEWLFNFMDYGNMSFHSTLLSAAVVILSFMN